MITGRIVRTVDDRLSVAPATRKLLAKVLPDHWSFMLGEVALYAFVTLIATGTYLALFFEPSLAETTYDGSYIPLAGESMSAAYASTVELSYDIRAGLLIRQAHHWSAMIFVGAIILHLCRIFFTGAFRKPREFNWLIGVTMLMLALVNGFSGYSLPDDLLSGNGLRIVYSGVLSVPVAGPWLAFGIFGGEFPAEGMIARLFVTHVFIVPGLLVALITLHLTILVRQKHSQFRGVGRTEHNVVGSRLWPAYVVRTLALLATVLAVIFALGGLVQINPVWIYGPYHPAHATTPAQPDWYIAWAEGALRLFPPADFQIFGYLVPTLFFPGVVLGGLTFAGLYAWPFVEAKFSKDREAHHLLDRPRDHPVRLGIGVAVLTFYAVLLLAAADVVLAHFLEVPIRGLVWTFRVLTVCLPVVTGFVAFYLALVLRNSSAGSFTELTWADLRNKSPAQPKPPDERGHSGHIEVWDDVRSHWWWRYVEQADDGRQTALVSHTHYPGRPEAEQAARTAYPGAVVVEHPDKRRPPSGPVERVAAATIWLWLIRRLLRGSRR